jgi:hypothetical protein
VKQTLGLLFNRLTLKRLTILNDFENVYIDQCIEQYKRTQSAINALQKARNHIMATAQIEIRAYYRNGNHDVKRSIAMMLLDMYATYGDRPHGKKRWVAEFLGVSAGRISQLTT